MTRKMVNLQRLIADDSELRRQVGSAMSAALAPIPNGTCIGYTAGDMADVMLSISIEIVPRSSAHAEHRIGARVVACRLN